MWGSSLAFLGVAAGAFGAHGLKKYFETYPDLPPVFKTAVEYHLIHALAILSVAWASEKWPNTMVHLAGYLFVAGIIVFSGSLYTLCLTRARWIGAVTPLGGLALLAGWICLALGAAKGGG